MCLVPIFLSVHMAIVFCVVTLQRYHAPASKQFDAASASRSQSFNQRDQVRKYLRQFTLKPTTQQRAFCSPSSSLRSVGDCVGYRVDARSHWRRHRRAQVLLFVSFYVLCVVCFFVLCYVACWIIYLFFVQCFETRATIGCDKGSHFRCTIDLHAKCLTLDFIIPFDGKLCQGAWARAMLDRRCIVVNTQLPGTSTARNVFVFQLIIDYQSFDDTKSKRS